MRETKPATDITVDVRWTAGLRTRAWEELWRRIIEAVGNTREFANKHGNEE